MAHLSKAIPREVGGWRARSPDKFYDRKTIFDYIDGGAELYLAYNFKELLSRRYVRPGKPSILLDIFDMGTPADAFGVFTAERLGEDVGVGEGSEYEPGLLRFWRGRFFVSITAVREAEGVREAIFSLGRMVAEALGKPVLEPSPLLKLLPKRGLQKLAVRLFRTHYMLNRFLPLAEGNVLGLDKRCEGLVAPYRLWRETVHLLLVLYPSEEQARKGEEGLLKAVKVKRRGFSAVARRGRLLMAALDSPTEEAASSLLKQVEALARKARLGGPKRRRPSPSRTQSKKTEEG